jgi:hypothetical protein
VRQFKIKVNPELFNGWKDLGLSFQFAMNGASGMVQNSMIVKGEEIEEFKQDLLRRKKELDERFEKLLAETVDYVSKSPI